MAENYELVLILKDVASADGEKKVIEQVKKLIVSLGGKIKSEEDLGKRIFSYKIKKERQGYYFVFTIDLAGKEVKVISEKLKMDDNILRYLVLRKE